MPLSRDQSNQLIAAGSVPLPPYSPDAGILYKVATRLDEAVVCIEQHVSDFQFTRYYVRARQIRAVLKTFGTRRHRDFGVWLFGEELRTFLDKLPDEAEHQAAQQAAQQTVLQRHPQQLLLQLLQRQKQKTAQQQQQEDELDRYAVVFVQKGANVLAQTERATCAEDVDEEQGDCCFKDKDGGYGDCC
jgi:hypothetical protein